MSIQHMQMVFDAEGFTPGEKSTLLAYCNFTDPHGYCWPGVERVADMTGLSERGLKKIRKALIERGLLATATRINAQGVRTTNITRVNLDKLASMRMPEKTYKDNVVQELEFADDAPDQPKCTGCTSSDQPKCTECPDPVNSVPLKDGALSAPYPSGDPSGDPSSSSAEVEDITHEATPPAPKKKTSKPQDREQAKTLIGEHFPDSADDEREAIIDLVYAEAAAKGVKIGFIATYIGGRPAALLEQDLAQVRRHSAAPTVTHCGIHQAEMKPYGCDACAAEIKAGDRDQAAAHLALVGEKARPDLARLLEALVTPVDNVRSLDEGERIRRMQRKPYGVVGGSRDPLPPHSEYQRLAGMTSDQIGAEML